MQKGCKSEKHRYMKCLECPLEFDSDECEDTRIYYDRELVEEGEE